MQDQNVNFMPWNDINEEEDLPTGTFHAHVIHAEDGQSNTSGKRMLRVGFNVLAPEDCANLAHFENYVVGTEEQPLNYGKDTRGGRAFKKLCVKANVPESSDVPTLLNSLRAGAEVMIAVKYNPESDFKNNITNYFRIGERPAAVAPSQIRPGAQTGAPVAPPMVPAAPVAPPMVAPAIPAPVVPVAVAPVAMPAPVAPAPVAAPAPIAPPAMVAPVAPPVAPVAVAPPVAPVAPVPVAPAPVAPAAPAPTAVAAPVGGPMMLCTICQQPVAAQDFAAHVQGHVTNPG